MPAAFLVQAATRSLAGWRPWLLKPRRAHADGDEARWTARTSVCDSTCGTSWHLTKRSYIPHQRYIVRRSYSFKSAAARARAAAPGCTAPRRRSGMSRNDRTGSHQVYAAAPRVEWPSTSRRPPFSRDRRARTLDARGRCDGVAYTSPAPALCRRHAWRARPRTRGRGT